MSSSPTLSASPALELPNAPARAEQHLLAPRRHIGRALPLILVLSAAVRLWQIDELGFNSDEAVYAGQAASIADEPALSELFPVFRAHPLLFQTVLSVGFHVGLGDWFARVVVVAFGVATVYLVYELGRLLYGRGAGLIAALVLALMPYHVVVSRQVLLDGPMVFFAVLTLVLLVRFVVSGERVWLYGASVAMGLTFLTKETSIVLLGAVYAFLALTPELRVRLRDLAISAGVLALTILPFPLTLTLAGHSGTGESYLTWQLFRRPNHDWLFYPSTVPEAIGPLVLAAAAAGLWLLRGQASWRETLLLCWIAVPVAFFQLWPVKGFQYLLPIAPAIAVLAGRTVARHRALGPVAAAILTVSLLIPTLDRIGGGTPDGFLAGSGGLPGGREAGEWIAAEVPEGAAFMTIGPSMANLVQYYGRRPAYGLSVSPNPLNRNPSYEPIVNPDAAIRENELQYVVWDAFSAQRSPHFARELRQYARRYNGRVVHTELLRADTARGSSAERPAVVVYEVRP